ncbi:hypothetical protein Esti_002558 [Eimeria stiedai]
MHAPIGGLLLPWVAADSSASSSSSSISLTSSNTSSSSSNSSTWPTAAAPPPAAAAADQPALASCMQQPLCFIGLSRVLLCVSSMRGGNPERRLIQAPAGGGDPYRQASPRGGGALLPGGSPSAPPPPSSGSRHLPSSAFGRGSSGGPQGMAEGWAPTSGASQWGAPLGESVGYGRAGAGAPSFGAVHAGIGRDGCYYTEAANHMIDECTDAAGELSSPHNLGAAGAPSEQGPHTVRRGAQGERGLLLVRGSQANGKKGETLPYVAGRSCARLCGETRTKASAAAAGAAQLTDPDDRRFFAQQQQQQQGGGDRWRVSFVRLGSGCSSDITGDSMEGPPAFGNGSGAPHEGGRMCPSDEGGGPPSPPPRGSSSAASVAAYSHRPSRYISTAGAALLSQGGGRALELGTEARLRRRIRRAGCWGRGAPSASERGSGGTC